MKLGASSVHRSVTFLIRFMENSKNFPHKVQTREVRIMLFFFSTFRDWFQNFQVTSFDLHRCFILLFKTCYLSKDFKIHHKLHRKLSAAFSASRSSNSLSTVFKMSNLFVSSPCSNSGCNATYTSRQKDTFILDHNTH